jgi:type IV secretion system protein VirB4
VEDFLLWRKADKNRNVEGKEKSFASMLPYKYHYDDHTILTKNNQFISVIKVDGFSFETADDEDLENKKMLRNNLFKGMAGSGLSIYFHTIRRKYSAFPEGEFKNIFTDMLNRQWKQRHNPEHTFINEHYISIIKDGPNKHSALLQDLFEKIKGGSSSGDNLNKKLLREAYAEIAEVRDRLLNGFSSYKPHLLGVRTTNVGNFSEICEFLGMIGNLGFVQNMLVPRGNNL